MKRFFGLLTALILLGIPLSFSAAKGEGPAAFGYDFDLRFHLNVDAFPASQRTRMSGYADLLSNLEIRGQLAWSPDYQCMDASFSIIPVTNPSVSLDFRLFGYSSHLLLTSPLLGNETILFNNEALMEFSLKTYSHLGIPLPYLALLFPYSTYNAFYYAVEAWQREIGYTPSTMTVRSSWISNLAAAWEELLQNDTALLDWFSAVSLQSDASETLQAELQAVPSYIRKQLTGGKDVKVTVRDGVTSWKGPYGVFFRKTELPGDYELESDFPLTANGFLPVFFYAVREEDRQAHTLLRISCESTMDTLIEAGIEGNEENLIQLSADCTLPTVWPVDGTYHASVSLDGQLLPPVHLSAVLTGESSGAVLLSISDTTNEQEVFQVSGTLNSVPVDEAPWFDKNWMIQFLNIFSVNDVTLQVFVHQIARPAFFGLLDFLVEIPASACQSVMDDLTDSGVLRLLLGE